MDNNTKEEFLNQGYSRYRESGISTEMLTRAAETAAKLCEQSKKAGGSTVLPCHFADYQRLFLDLAARMSHDEPV